MPVTIKVATHNANVVGAAGHPYLLETDKSSQAVLERLAHKDLKEIGSILKTKLGQQTSITQSRLQDMRLSVQDHGLVRAAFHAYSDHHHLVLRPDDIWTAILSQFSFFVNAHAEDLRSSFVAHEGKKGLILRDPGQPDMGLMCRNMTRLIDENIVDPQLREWILPSFSTTTIHDEVVASIMMMGTLQRYFDYVFDCSTCGIPSVTLLGEQSDWENIGQRIERLTQYGEEPERFCKFLRPIVRNFVASFQLGPQDATVVDFWSRIIDRRIGSGMDTLTGWMAAFCFWDEDGKCLASKRRSTDWLSRDYHSVEFDQVPCAFVSVPVTYITPDNVVIDTKLLAGFIGFEATSLAQAKKEPSIHEKDSVPQQTQLSKLPEMMSRICNKLKMRPKDENHGNSTAPQQSNVAEHFSAKDVRSPEKPSAASQPLDTIRPVTGWWMYEIRNGSNTGQMRRGFFAKKMKHDWQGQVSTGYIGDDGQMMSVKDRLPDY